MPKYLVEAPAATNLRYLNPKEVTPALLEAIEQICDQSLYGPYHDQVRELQELFDV